MITVALVGASVPKLAQITVSETPDGEEWVLSGSAQGMSWTVPGGMGVGDGEALVLADNRAPLNTPVTYVLTSGVGTESSMPVVIPGPVGDVVLQSLDGQVSVAGTLQDGTQALVMDPSLALFNIPGRRNAVSRFALTGTAHGGLVLRTVLGVSDVMDRLLGSGEPVLVRYTAPAMDLPVVQAVQFTGVSSDAHLVAGFREWQLPYVVTDDPFMDRRLGAFTWEFIDGLQVDGSTVIRDGAAMEAALAGLTWGEIDAFDWSLLS